MPVPDPPAVGPYTTHRVGAPTAGVSGALVSPLGLLRILGLAGRRPLAMTAAAVGVELDWNYVFVLSVMESVMWPW